MCTISKKTVVRANNASMQKGNRVIYTAATAKDSVRISFMAGGTTHHRTLSTKDLNSAYAKALKSK